MSFLASISAHVKKYLEAATAFVLRVKDRIPGYRHSVIAAAAIVIAVVGAAFGEDSDLFQGVVALAAALGINRVKNRPDPVKRARKR